MKNIVFGSRDQILDWFFRVPERPVLNEGECEKSSIKQIPREIANNVLALKQSAIIDDGGVNYSELREREVYQQFRDWTCVCLQDFNLSVLQTQEEKLAFWINLYNLLTIDAELQYSVKKSVTEGWFGVISFFRRAAYLVGGYRFSLEDIQHGILRANRGVPFFPGKQFTADDPRKAFAVEEFDARIHFALNCAGRSDPPIAYHTPSQINDQLDLAATNFIGGETTLDKSGVVLRISKIFKWYARDFDGRMGMLAFIKKYLPENDLRRKLIENFGKDVMIQFAPFNWRLNVLG
ncbi:MAG: DUF547 domain-containing protein [Pelolinea sp.]|nr:DUF547 domain-containing protein [Pelolinea sp.]